MSSQILVVMPPEWLAQDTNYVVSNTGYSLDWYANVTSLADLNETLHRIGYFPEGSDQCVVDSTVVAENLYFKFDTIRD